MKKLYDKFMDLNIKTARAKAERRGLSFNEENFIKKQEAVLPILFFYGLTIYWVLYFPTYSLSCLPGYFLLYYLVLS